MTIEDLNPTTRCHPREMRTAFPFDYPVVEHYKRRSNNNYVVAILYIVGIIAVLIAIKVM